MPDFTRNLTSEEDGRTCYWHDQWEQQAVLATAKYWAGVSWLYVCEACLLQCGPSSVKEPHDA